jgi:hypothetical protein
LLHFDHEHERENVPLIENQGHFSTAESVDRDDHHTCSEHCLKPNSGDSLIDNKKHSECPKSKTIHKHRKHIFKCGHHNEEYYANGMCKNCYHAKGRTKMAFACSHTDRTLYAKGLCKNCYLSIYHKSKKSTRMGSSNSREAIDGAHHPNNDH